MCQGECRMLKSIKQLLKDENQTVKSKLGLCKDKERMLKSKFLIIKYENQTIRSKKKSH